MRVLDLPLPADFPGTIDGMKTTIDDAGRVVIPKDLRSALNLNGGDEIEITRVGEKIELSPAPRQVHLRRGPRGILTAELNVPEHGPEEVREALERTRR
jgi:AbrB family looped-hinge helix DNA binding protein